MSGEYYLKTKGKTKNKVRITLLAPIMSGLNLRQHVFDDDGALAQRDFPKEGNRKRKEMVVSFLQSA